MTDRYDEPVTVDLEHPLRLSADCLRALKKATGQTLSELLGDGADEIDKFQVLAFADLYRRHKLGGHMPDSATLWEEAGAVDLDFVAEAPDPLGGGS